jgi:HPt (histidine-containing phosphotransfer) domain-containing protein
VLVPRTHAAAPAPLEVDTTELLNWTAIMHLLSSFQMPPAEATGLIINLYEREILAQIAAVTSAAQADDRPLVARLSHKLRGGSQQLGATALAAVCARLEAAAKHPDSPALDGEIAQLHTLYDRTWALLQERIHVLD